MSSSCHHSLVTDDGQLAGCEKSFQISVDTELQRRPVDARHKSLSSGRAQARTRGPGITISFEFNNLRDGRNPSWLAQLVFPHPARAELVSQIVGL
jgi:hypothetical protein